MTDSGSKLLIGTAGWTVPREAVADFPVEGTHLQRYAAVLPAAEINSSFHRPHRASTWRRWRQSVPDHFRFSVKLPKTITHVAKLADAIDLLEEFLGPIQELGETLGCLLVQLPPSLGYDPHVAPTFLEELRLRFAGGIACEPRHPTWLEPEANRLLTNLGIARVAADPDKPVGASEPGGATDLIYYRLHGSPRIYFSSYESEYLAQLAEKLKSAGPGASAIWCIFDNTTLGAATPNALELMSLMRGHGQV